jgi:SOS response regulatory protein OraA/RecX
MPVDQVRALRARGLDNNQIVQALQRSGYSSTQIFDAINQADLVSGSAIQDNTAFSSSPAPSMQQQQQYAPQQEQQMNNSGGDLGDEQIEEMIETIVEEKWQSVSSQITKLTEWKGEVDARLAKMDARMDELKNNYDRLHQAVIGKIGEYDKNILAVGAEIKAMEKVFSKVLPLFTENVNELNRVTQTLSQTFSRK